ncbi:uncharacterized protein LOC123980285 isoform X3 [Micropterus dolomieu]|uniref:uncharacterized protein LOC123980285 isoform X3 n=1 Tax=Micropterus dolomieu TaxID=147949 RepID=UPI001E8EDC93|nr:uncharacterized protein LOC123980285 isoform X3 [Micropterus dolomieu]
MDPAVFSLPEIITHPGSSNFFPHYHQPRPAYTSASQDVDNRGLIEPSLLISREVISRGQFHRSGPHHVMNESASQRTSTVAEILRSIANTDQRRTDTQFWTQCISNQRHLIPGLTVPIEPQTQAQDSLSPLNLQTLSPDPRSHVPACTDSTLTIFTSCSPHNSFLLNMSPVASTANTSFGFSPYVLAPICGPTELCYSPYSPPHSWLLPEVHPSWCLCPLMHVHQPCSTDLVSRGAVQQVSEQINATSAASGRDQNEEQAKSEVPTLSFLTEEQQNENKPDKDKLQAENTNCQTTKSKVSPESLPPLDEESLAERAFEEYMIIMDSLSPEIQERVAARQNEKEAEKSSFLEYLDELCSDEVFVRRAGSTLNTEYLDSLLSSDPEPIDLLPLKELEQEALEVILQQHLHPPAADSNSVSPVTKEASPAALHVEETAPAPRAQSRILDPTGSQSDTNPDINGQNAPLSTRNIGSKVRTPCSALLPSLLTEKPLPPDPTTNYCNPVNATSTLYYEGSLFMDYSFKLSQQLLAKISRDTSLTSDLETRGNGELVEEAAASVSLSNLADTQSAQASQNLQGGPIPGNPPASESPSTSSISGSIQDPHTIVVKDPVPSFRADLLNISPPQSASPPALSVLAWKTLPRPLPPPPAQIREPEEQCSPKSSCPEDYTILMPAHSVSPAESCDPLVDGNSSDAVPEKQTIEATKGQQVSGVYSELSARKPGETERKCDKNLGKGVGTTVTQEPTARKEEMTKKTSERKDDEENEAKLKGTTNTRRRPRLSDLNEREKTRLSGELTIETAEERKPSEKSIKKTVKITPERDERVINEKEERRPSGGRRLHKREESHFEERSQATKTANTAKQFSETGEKEHQKLVAELQKLNVEGGKQCEANNPRESTEMGAENALTAQEEKQLGEGIERREEGIQMSVRRTRSMTIEEKVQPTLPAAGSIKKVKHSQTERSEIRSSPERGMQEDDKLKGNVKEEETDPQTPLISSPMKRSRSRRDAEESGERAKDADSTGRKTNEEQVSGNCSLQSPRVQTGTHSIKDSIKESPGEGPLDKRNESPCVTTCENNPHLTPARCQEARQQSETVALSGDGADRGVKRGETDQHGNITGPKTWGFYNLRSQTQKLNASKRTVNRRGVQEEEATQQLSNTKPCPDQTADVKGEDERINEEAEGPSLMLSPMKRHWHERTASEEREERVNKTVRTSDKVRTETEMISSSPVKRGRCWCRAERDEQQKLTVNRKGQDEAETSGAPSASSNRKAKEEEISDASAGRSSAIETRTSLKGTLIPRFPSKRLRCEKVPTKYQEFILGNTNRPQRQLDTEIRKGKHQEVERRWIINK